jgi:hypothetical protein
LLNSFKLVWESSSKHKLVSSVFIKASHFFNDDSLVVLENCDSLN